MREHLGTNHPAVAAALHNLGVLVMHFEHYQNAQMLLKRAINIFKKARRLLLCEIALSCNSCPPACPLFHGMAGFICLKWLGSPAAFVLAA